MQKADEAIVGPAGDGGLAGGGDRSQSVVRAKLENAELRSSRAIMLKMAIRRV